jgi:hypothetical protein
MTPEQTADEYEAALREWAGLSAAGGKAARLNRLVDQMQQAYLVFKKTPEGRASISRLAADPDGLVRVWAAGAMLAWDAEGGRAVLTTLRDSGGPGSFAAKWTLIELEKGTLKLDWDPDRDGA